MDGQRKIWHEIHEKIEAISINDLDFLPDNTKQQLMSLFELGKDGYKKSLMTDESEEIMNSVDLLLSIIALIFKIINSCSGN